MSKFIVNSFQVPNALVDDLMSTMSGNAFKCYVFIARKTTGWGKVSDRISVSQFMKTLGAKDKRTVYAATKELIDLGLITAIKSNGEITEFSLVLEPVTKNDTSDKECSKPVTKNVPATSDKKCTSTKDTINTNTKYKDISAKAPKKSHQIREDFSPTEKHKLLADELNVNLLDEFTKFCDYAKANGKVYKDWDAAFNNWIRNSTRFWAGGAKPKDNRINNTSKPSNSIPEGFR